MEDKRPNLFIVGAAKSGTTSLHYYLSQHPKIFMSRVKEPNHFSDAKSGNKLEYKLPKKNESAVALYIKDENTYLSLFDDARDEIYRGEASAGYLYDETSAKRIFDFNPEARIILILREPVDRAFSNYKMNYNLGIEHERNFLQAISNDQANPDKTWGGAPLYIEAGLYYQQIKRYAELFPGNHICILKFEDFVRDPMTSIKQILAFLGLDFTEIPELNLEPKNQILLIRSNSMRHFLFIVRRSRFLIFVKSLLPATIKKSLMKHFTKKDRKFKGPADKLTERDKDYLEKTYFRENKELLKKEYHVSWE